MNDFCKISMKSMMTKLLKGVKATDAGVKEIKSHFSTMSQLVDSYSTLVEHLEHQMSQLSAAFN